MTTQSWSRSSSGPRPTPTTPRGWAHTSPTRTRTWRSRCTAATSRSTRTSSASSSAAVGARLDSAPLTLRDLAARPVTDLRAVGDKLSAGLAEMGIETVLDLLEHYPRRYVDRTERAEIHELAIGDEATVDAEVKSIHARRTRHPGVVVREGRELPRQAADDQPGRRRARRPRRGIGGDRHHRACVPAVGK